MINQTIAVVALVAALWLGWTAKGWQADALDLAGVRAAQIATDAANERGAVQARTLIETLERLKANEKTIYQQSVKLVDRPVYHSVCLDADGLRLINAAKNGTTPGGNAPGVP